MLSSGNPIGGGGTPCTDSPLGGGREPQGVVGLVVSAAERCLRAEFHLRVGSNRQCGVENIRSVTGVMSVPCDGGFGARLLRVYLRRSVFVNSRIKKQNSQKQSKTTGQSLTWLT